jgi:hypothetical protein
MRLFRRWLRIAPEVVFASAEKGHVILRHATRVRADGSPIEAASALFALTRTPAGRKFFAFSGITFPSGEAIQAA